MLEVYTGTAVDIKMIFHYDANDNHTNFMDGVLEPDETDQNGNQYHDIEAYEAEQERQTNLIPSLATYTGLEQTNPW